MNSFIEFPPDSRKCFLCNQSKSISKSFGCINENISQGRSYFQTNIHASDCFFVRMSTLSGDGGVIYVSQNSLSMNISYSTFCNCSCSQGGGTIFFSSDNFLLKMVCANRCYNANWGHFSWNSVTRSNAVEYLSILSSSYTAFGYCPFYMRCGDQRIDNTNSSINYVVQISGMALVSSNTFTSTHCTFSNSYSSDSRCLYFDSISGQLSFTNIVHNYSPLGGILYSYRSSLQMNFCILTMNQGTLFNADSSSIELSHCFISHDSLLSAMNPVITSNNNSFTNFKTYNLEFYKTQFCNADYQRQTFNQGNWIPSRKIFISMLLMNNLDF